MTTNNAVSGALERPNPEVCARSALSTHHTSPCATIVALFDNWQAVVRTDRSPSFHPASSLAPVGKYKEREEAAYSLGLLGWASLSDALHPGLSVKRRGGSGRKRQPCQQRVSYFRRLATGLRLPTKLRRQ